MSVTESARAGEFILSEGNGKISRERIVIAAGNNLKAGTVVGKITASDKHKNYDNGAADGSESADGILYADVNATDGDMPGVMVARLAEVNSSLLIGSDADGLADLEAKHVIAR